MECLDSVVLRAEGCLSCDSAHLGCCGMIKTKRYDYIPIDRLKIHPEMRNHRTVDPRKVAHYFDDILKHGLLEPLVVCEGEEGDFYLLGGFHRLTAIRRIRARNPGYYDRIDVRVVEGNVEEMRALNLKLNSDRVGLRESDFFETVMYLHQSEWSASKIADFLDRSEDWIAELIRYVPDMPEVVRCRLESNQLSWAKAKTICSVLEKLPQEEREAELARQLSGRRERDKRVRPKRPFTVRQIKGRIEALSKEKPGESFRIDSETLLALIQVVDGKTFSPSDVKHLEESLPELFGS